MPLLETKGAASAQGFGMTLQQTAANYIEDVFSTWLYTGNGSTQTITNGIDLAGEGGLVWIKDRTAANPAWIMDTVRGVASTLQPSTTGAAGSISNAITAFNAAGFSLGANLNSNTNNNNYASWTFRKQPKFFDVVTYTGTGVARTVPHNLGSVPGVMMVKRTDTTGRWFVYHKDIPNTSYLVLNTTAASVTGANVWNNTSPTSTNFTVGINTELNTSGGTYVAYLFAHDAGGFGLTGTDNVISCGSYTGNGSATGPVVSLGYEPQWLLIKNATDGSTNWTLVDNMRGFPVGSAAARLHPNLSDAEYTNITVASPLPTGFQITNTNSFCNTNGSTYIYIAIRRGPMKTPTSGTSVFAPITYTGDGTTARDFTNFGMLPDFVMLKQRNGTEPNHVIDRLRGGGNYLISSSAQAESAYPVLSFDSMNGVNDLDSYFNASGATWVFEAFRRAPGFFDEVCYTGTGSARTVAHNLGVAPELMIVKQRNASSFNWAVYSAALGAGSFLELNTTAASTAFGGIWNSTTPTSTVFSLGTSGAGNASGVNYVAHLFASCPGVSKVGSYTGTGTTQQINCGFTAGSRFVLIKRTDSTGDWYVWDSARGIVAGNDPYLLLNSTAAEVTTTDYIDPVSSGFEISSTAPAGINASGGTYIFLAIA